MDMFDDVPDSLTRRVRTQLSDGLSVGDKDIGAALAVIAHFVGPKLSGDLFRAGDNVPIAHIAVTLFEMRNAKGFGEFCNRMRNRRGLYSHFLVRIAHLVNQ
jgi:hypothetical protein